MKRRGRRENEEDERGREDADERRKRASARWFAISDIKQKGICCQQLKQHVDITHLLSEQSLQRDRPQAEEREVAIPERLATTPTIKTEYCADKGWQSRNSRMLRRTRVQFPARRDSEYQRKQLMDAGLSKAGCPLSVTCAVTGDPFFTFTAHSPSRP